MCMAIYMYSHTYFIPKERPLRYIVVHWFSPAQRCELGGPGEVALSATAPLQPSLSLHSISGKIQHNPVLLLVLNSMLCLDTQFLANINSFPYSGPGYLLLTDKVPLCMWLPPRSPPCNVCPFKSESNTSPLHS